jgi:hypothetical protein
MYVSHRFLNETLMESIRLTSAACLNRMAEQLKCAVDHFKV